MPRPTVPPINSNHIARRSLKTRVRMALSGFVPRGRFAAPPDLIRESRGVAPDPSGLQVNVFL